MALPSIEVQCGDCPSLEQFLAARIYEYNATATGYFDGEAFGATHKDPSGAIVAGIAGYTWGGCCFVSYLWVADGIRRSGLGRALLMAAEDHAISKGCSIALLSSHSFQAPRFYERLGYEERAVIEDHPPGHSNVFYAKRLASNAMP